jgi:hypothetical protein
VAGAVSIDRQGGTRIEVAAQNLDAHTGAKYPQLDSNQ